MAPSPSSVPAVGVTASATASTTATSTTTATANANASANASANAKETATATANERRLVFPAEFAWGVSTSAHQFEGGLDDNNWGAWERRGKIKTGERAGLACDWWRHAERDFDLARDMGLNALRMSVEWSRVEPREGEFDERALERYREMVRALHARGLRPWICLHHFTNPMWFELRGGFLDPESPRLFARFADRVTDALGDLCYDWLTFNEPNVYTTMGFQLGEFPPGLRGGVKTTMRALRNIVRAHAAAYRAIHARRSAARVGFTQNFFLFEPDNPRSPLDRSVAKLTDLGFNAPFVEILRTGRPPAPLAWLGRPIDEARGTYDFAGFNYYGRFNLKFDASRPQELFAHRFVRDGAPEGDRGVDSPYAEIYPHGLSIFAERIASLGKPIYVLENGVPDATDRIRPWLVAQAAKELHDLVRRGVDVRGYFHWSLVDNFEWNEGWRLRFGLVELDPVTQRRTMRNSGRLYGAMARANALCESDVIRWAPGAASGIFAP